MLDYINKRTTIDPLTGNSRVVLTMTTFGYEDTVRKLAWLEALEDSGVEHCPDIYDRASDLMYEEFGEGYWE